MEYKILNNTDLKVSSVALGTDVYGTVLDTEQSYKLLDTYVSSGGNIIDTALIYANWFHLGESLSEKLIGKWMKERHNRHEIILSTKGAHPEVMGISRLSREEILSDIDKSLKHLQTDYIDIYWLHRDDEALPVGPVMETLGEIVKSGKARYIGMSNWTHRRIQEANDYAKKHNLPQLTGSQIQYSAAVPNAENNDPTLVLMNDEEYNYFTETKMSVFAYASQAKGFFSKYDIGGEANLNEKARHRYFNEKTLRRYKKIKEISLQTGRTVGEIAIGVIANNPNFPTIPIVGCKNVNQLKESMSGSNLCLDKDLISFIHSRK